MKIVAVEISIEHLPETEEGIPAAASPNESFTLAVSLEVDDATETGPIVKQLMADLQNRYDHLNARKTN
jgi:hypothetical protein